MASSKGKLFHCHPRFALEGEHVFQRIDRAAAVDVDDVVRCFDRGNVSARQDLNGEIANHTPTLH